MLGACQPVMPVEPGAPATMEESAPETAIADEEVAEQAPVPAEPLRVLFLADPFLSENWGVDGHFSGMAAAGDPPLTVETDEVIRGSLEQLWEGETALTKLEAGDWDVVVLHQDLPYFATEFIGDDASPEGYAATEEAFLEYACKFAEAAAQTGAKTVIVVPWEYLTESFVSLDDFVRLVETTASDCGAEVAPVGQAWKRVMEVNPEVAIYDLNGDWPTLLGTYLSAAVLYATLLDCNPSEIDYSPADILPDHRSVSFLRAQYEAIPAEDLAFLRQMAWETVQKYRAGE
jgi:hypothetical protein